MIPPCALATHLCIGQAYALSVFNLPLTRQLGITKSLPERLEADRSSAGSSRIAIVVLGASAALFGKWVQAGGAAQERRGRGAVLGLRIPGRRARDPLHQLWLVYLGYGVLGGCGLGIGYITPVSTLIAWFPDRRGMATGMAIMGFGGGALIASPLSDLLMKHFAIAELDRRRGDLGRAGRALPGLHDRSARSGTACPRRAGRPPAGSRRRRSAGR